MKIKSIKFRNIGPYGNNTQEFTFNDYGRYGYRYYNKYGYRHYSYYNNEKKAIK